MHFYSKNGLKIGMVKQQTALPDKLLLEEMSGEYPRWVGIVTTIISQADLPPDLKSKAMSDAFDALVNERLVSPLPDEVIEEITARIANKAWQRWESKGFTNFGEMAGADKDENAEMTERRIQRRIKNAPSPFEILFEGDKTILRLPRKGELLERIGQTLNPEERSFLEEDFSANGKLRRGGNVEQRRRFQLIKLKNYLALRQAEPEAPFEERFLGTMRQDNI